MFKTYKENITSNRSRDFSYQRENKYNLHNCSYFTTPAVSSVYYGSESISNLGPRIWNLVPIKLKELKEYFKFIQKTDQKLETR